ncbi:MAG: hypothetical protein L0G49_00625 [Luteococcus sp.]|uniref:hypothetical protein n=1 Tax=Luteococcus sp. TaxID=1969402 RepID=UPI0026470737|nr:hypothetical protein [Luteococcus sp.]MDN5562279.1 hypothetical protein [Luteococcus sp.]
MPQADDEAPAKNVPAGRAPETSTPKSEQAPQRSVSSRMLPNMGNDLTVGGLVAGLRLVVAGATTLVIGRKRK